MRIRPWPPGTPVCCHSHNACQIYHRLSPLNLHSARSSTRIGRLFCTHHTASESAAFSVSYMSSRKAHSPHPPDLPPRPATPAGFFMEDHKCDHNQIHRRPRKAPRKPSCMSHRQRPRRSAHHRVHHAGPAIQRRRLQLRHPD